MKIGNIDFTIEATKLSRNEFKKAYSGTLRLVDINEAFKLLHAKFKTKNKTTGKPRRKQAIGKNNAVKKAGSIGHRKGKAR